MLCLQKSRRWNWLFPAIGWYCLCAVLMQVMSVWWLLTALYCSSCQRLHANNPHSPSYSCAGLCYMGTVPEKWWKRFKTPLTLYYPAFFFFFFLDAPVLWMLTDSGSVPLPALTKHLSEGGRKAFQPSTPLSPWECGSRDGTWHGGGMGKWGFL